jgi:hypothetical protein
MYRMKGMPCMVECICPYCSIKHLVHMLWTGRGTPKIYCKECRIIVSEIDYSACKKIKRHLARSFYEESYNF